VAAVRATAHGDEAHLDIETYTWSVLPGGVDDLVDGIAAELLPPGGSGSISTLPLGWRTPWTADDDARATAALRRVSNGLRDLRDRTGRTIRLAIEPEPGCVLDTVADVVRWLAPRLRAPASDAETDAAADRRADGIDPEHVGICLDTCHLAVSFADPAATVRLVESAGIRIVKVQASAALHVDDPADPPSRAAVAAFVEQRYLHQTRELGPDGGVTPVDDLPEALEDLPADGPWRVHFHVPLHLAPTPPLRASTDVLREAVTAVRATRHGDEAHLDIETYTWSVLPGGVDDLVDGIAAELRWALEELLTEDEAAAVASARTPVALEEVAS
jgi:sugar phosphate isomerase/epimerase